MDINISDILYRGINHVEDLGRTSRVTERISLQQDEDDRSNSLEMQLRVCRRYRGSLDEAQARSFCREFISTYESGFRKGRRVDQAMKEYDKLMRPRMNGSGKVFIRQGLCYVIAMMHRKFLSPVED